MAADDIRNSVAASAWRYLCYVLRTDRLARAAFILLVCWLLLLVVLEIVR